MPTPTAPPPTHQSQLQASRVVQEPRDVVARIASAGAGQWKGLLKVVLVVVAVLLLLEVRSTKRYVQQHQNHLQEHGQDHAESSFKLPSLDVQHVEQLRSETKNGNVRGAGRIAEKNHDVDPVQSLQPSSTLTPSVSVSRKPKRDKPRNRQRNESKGPTKQNEREGSNTLAVGNGDVKRENGAADPKIRSKSSDNAKGKNRRGKTRQNEPRSPVAGDPKAKPIAAPAKTASTHGAGRVQMTPNLLEVCGRNLHVYIAQQASGFGGVGNLVTKVNAGLTFAITNELPYIFPELDPTGHEAGESFKKFFDTSMYLVHDAAVEKDTPRRHRLVSHGRGDKLPDYKLMLRCPSRTKNFDFKSSWEKFGGFDGTTAETEWGPGIADDDRCKPSELLYNCESLARAPRNNERIRVVLPANLKYHREFTVTADIIAESYRKSRARHKADFPNENIWGKCPSAEQDSKQYKIALHVRLGDVADKIPISQRQEYSTPEGVMALSSKKRHTWGGKYVPPAMFLHGLDLLQDIAWAQQPPWTMCLALFTDGSGVDPEIEFLVNRLQNDYASGPGTTFVGVEYADGGVSPAKALHALTLADVTVASGSQFSRLAALLGAGVLVNPNYGYVDARSMVLSVDLWDTPSMENDRAALLALVQSQSTRLANM